MNNVFSLTNDGEPLNLLSKIKKTISFLKGKKTLVLGFSNRWKHPDKKRDIPKTEKIGRFIAEKIGNSQYMDVFNLKIYPCEANISGKDGNSCGVKGSLLKDKDKNPTGYHRCWASINHKDDELWKVSKAIFESEAIVFITPVRWGQACATYQNLMERLSWIQNRHTSLEENNIISDKKAAFICIGHNWNGKNILNTQKDSIKYYGFDLAEEACWYYQWTSDPVEETLEGYKQDAVDFDKKFTQLTIKNTDGK